MKAQVVIGSFIVSTLLLQMYIRDKTWRVWVYSSAFGIGVALIVNGLVK